MPKFQNLTDIRFGNLTVLKKSNEKKYGTQTQWVCLCDCGGIKIATTSSLNGGRVTTCGCSLSRRGNISNIENKRFGRLLAVRKTDKRKNGSVVWLCQCDCGKTKEVRQNQLASGVVRSCGCLISEMAKALCESNSKNLIGYKTGKLTVLSKTENRKGNGSILWECVCECGGKSFVASSALLAGEIETCGCATVNRLKSLTGEKHHNYNPLLTSEERLKKRYQLYGENLVAWRKDVYKRDNYTCAKCCCVGGTLNAHHIDSWDWCRDKRFDVTNGKTLCKKCHRLFHIKYGYGKNTEAQFHSFMREIFSSDC